MLDIDRLILELSGRHLLAGIALAIAPGEVHALVGPTVLASPPAPERYWARRAMWRQRERSASQVPAC